MEVLGANISDLDGVLKGCKSDSVKHKEMLYKGYYGYLKGVILRYVQDYQSVEELVNDSFVKIFNNISSFNAANNNGQTDLVKSFRSWVARIASRTAIDFLRKKKISFVDAEINDASLPAVAPTEPMYASDARDIMKLLDELTDLQKMIFNLYEIEGFSHDEISRMLSIRQSVSRSYLSRAKQKLKDLYFKKILN
ncbi:MAG: RNA polymerase sigma factor [Niabella sp.]